MRAAVARRPGDREAAPRRHRQRAVACPVCRGGRCGACRGGPCACIRRSAPGGADDRGRLAPSVRGLSASRSTPVSFESPLALIALVVVPVLVGLYVVRERRRQAYAARFTTPGLLPNLVDATPGWRRHLPLALFIVALAAMIVGVARPHASVEGRRQEATVPDRDRLVAVDELAGHPASRLIAAQRAAQASSTACRRVPCRRDRIQRTCVCRRSAHGGPVLVRSALKVAQVGAGDGARRCRRARQPPRAGRSEPAMGKDSPDCHARHLRRSSEERSHDTRQLQRTQARSLHIPVYTVVIGTQDGVVNVPLAGRVQRAAAGAHPTRRPCARSPV